MYPNTKEIVGLGCMCLTQGLLRAPTPSLGVIVTLVSEKMPYMGTGPNSLFMLSLLLPFVSLLSYISGDVLHLFETGIREQKIRARSLLTGPAVIMSSGSTFIPAVALLLPLTMLETQFCISWHPPPNMLLLQTLPEPS